ncbi:MAG: type IV pilus assembly protein PilM [Candidatus Marinimicrobia bacterium]|nr:type IV pilus assembly protein PilM [Candidatus Neomarinimicrobiota bacterium]
MVGLDIGRKEVKLVEIQKAPKGLKLVRFGSEPVVSAGKDFDPERIERVDQVTAVKTLLKNVKLNPKRVKHLVTSLNGQTTSIRQVKMMSASEDELATSLQLEAKKHIPLDGTDALMDYQVIGEDPKEIDKLNILLVASTQRNLDRHLDLLKEAGLRSGIVDCDAIGIANAYVMQSGLPEEGADVFVSIGAVSTTLVVWGRQAPFFTREIQVGGHDFTKFLAKQKDISYHEADELKIKEPFEALKKGVKPEEEKSFSIAVAERTIFDNLVDELRRSLRFYMKENNESYFNKIVLMGGAAATIGLSDFISQHLNVPVEIFNPFANFQPHPDSDVDYPAKYALAVGLALRGLEE